MIFIFIFLILIFSQNIFSSENIKVYFVNDPSRNPNTKHIYAIPADKHININSKLELGILDRIQISELTYDQKVDLVQQLRPSFNSDDFKPAKNSNPDEPSSATTTSWQDFIFDHKYQILGGTTLICLYGYIFWKLYKQYTFNYSFYWAYWKEEIPLEMLYAKPREKIRQELIASINHYYTNNDMSKTDPTLLFLKDVRNEITVILRFTHYYEFLKKYWLSGFFRSYEPAYKYALDKIDRLLFLEELFEKSMQEEYGI